MNYRAIVAALATLTAVTTAQAQQKLQIGCTATSDCASAMIAIDEGIFKKLGVDAEMVLIGINSNIPAALLSNSIQIGGPTTPVFLQAADGGLDLVAVAGASVMNERTRSLTTVFGRTGVSLKEPKDFVGKKVGAPGLGAFLHVLFVKWLMEKGVDPKKFNEAFNSFGVQSRVKRGDQMAQTYRIQGVPALAIDGRYLIGERHLANADRLIAQVRSQKKK